MTISKTHSLNVGDILRASWGYDQTNIDYFQVTALVGKSMVEVREIGYATRNEDAYMQGTCTPAPGNFLENAKPLRRKVLPGYNGDPSIKIFHWGCYARLHKPDPATGNFTESRWTAYA